MKSCKRGRRKRKEEKNTPIYLSIFPRATDMICSSFDGKRGRKATHEPRRPHEPDDDDDNISMDLRVWFVFRFSWDGIALGAWIPFSTTLPSLHSRLMAESSCQPAWMNEYYRVQSMAITVAIGWIRLRWRRGAVSRVFDIWHLSIYLDLSFFFFFFFFDTGFA